jgi:hypothetical protein
MTDAKMTRIEAALVRIEAAALAPRLPAKADINMQELRTRHENLRMQTKAVIAEIDTLIAEAG